MSVLIKNMEMPKGCIYANDNDQTEYCPLLNHDDVPFCQYIENEPESAIGIDERPVYCPLSDVPEPCQDTISRQAAIEALSMMQGIVAKEGVRTGIGMAWQQIKDLPSVQTHSEGLYIDGRNEGYSEGWKDGREALRREIWEDGRERDRLD